MTNDTMTKTHAQTVTVVCANCGQTLTWIDKDAWGQALTLPHFVGTDGVRGCRVANWNQHKPVEHFSPIDFAEQPITTMVERIESEDELLGKQQGWRTSFLGDHGWRYVKTGENQWVLLDGTVTTFYTDAQMQHVQDVYVLQYKKLV